MCTLFVAVGVWPGAPLVVAANRDERLDRPAAPPDVREHAGRRLVAPLDLQAGGTWIALGERGVLAAITNRHDPAYFGRTAAVSRGALVLDAAVADDSAGAARAAAAVDPEAVNPFHLLVADRRGAAVVWSDGTTVRHEVLGVGLHVLTERSYGAADAARERMLKAGIARLQSAPVVPTVEAWRTELSRHAGGSDPLAGTCVHADALGYGTRATTYVRLGDAPSDVELHHADGKPCVTALHDLSALVSRLHGS